MASAIDLEPLRAPKNPYTVPEEGVSLSDYARAVAAGAYGVAASVGGAFDYMVGEDSGGYELREWGQQGQRAQYGAMSAGARRALDANILPGGGETIWSGDVSTANAIGLRAAGVIPSLLASIIPGGVAARVALAAGAGVGTASAVGTAVGGAAGGVQSGGEVFNQITNALVETPDDQLQIESEVYRGLRRMGVTEEEAKDRLVRYAAGYAPLYMAGITAATSKWGVEGLVAGKAAGAAGRGIGRGALAGAAGEATQEAIEGSSGELMTQAVVNDARGRFGQSDWLKVLEAAAEGALVGGITGAGVGAATGRRRGVTIANEDLSEMAALAPDVPAPAPETIQAAAQGAGVGVNDEVAAVLDKPVPRAPTASVAAPSGHEMAATAEAKGDAPGVVLGPKRKKARVPVTAPTIGPDEAAALAGVAPVPENLQQGPPPRDVPSLPIDKPVVTPEVAQAIGAPHPDLPVDLPASPARLLPPSEPVEAPQPVSAEGPAGAVPPVPETPETLEAQFKSAFDKDSPRSAVLVTPGERLPKSISKRRLWVGQAPGGQGEVYVPRGKKASALGIKSNKDVTEHVAKNGFEGLIGKAVPVESTTEGPALVTRDAEGTELSASTVPTPEAAVAQAAEDKAQFPQAESVEIVPPEQVVAERLKSPAISATPASGSREVAGVAGLDREAPKPTGRVLENVAVPEGEETYKIQKDPRRLSEIITELRKENPDITFSQATEQAIAMRKGRRVERNVEVLKRERAGPRMTEAKKAQVAAGEKEVLGKREAGQRDRIRALGKIAERVRSFLEANKYPEGFVEATPAAHRAYAQAMVDAAEIGDVSLANLGKTDIPEEDRNTLTHLKAATKVAVPGKAGSVSTRQFIANDFDMRKGGDLVAQQRAASNVVAKVELNEATGVEGVQTVGGSETASHGAVENVEEDVLAEEISRKQVEDKRARLLKELEKRRAEKRAKALEEREELRAATAAKAAEAPPTRTVAVETVKRRTITPPGKTQITAAKAVQTRETRQAAAGTITAKTEAQAAVQLKAQLAQDMTADMTPGQVRADRSGGAGGANANLFQQARMSLARKKGDLAFVLDGRLIVARNQGTLGRVLDAFKRPAVGRSTWSLVDFFRRTFNADVNVYVVTRAEMERIDAALPGPKPERAALSRALWFPSNQTMIGEHDGAILIREDVLSGGSDTTAQTLVHEGVHDALADALDRNRAVSNNLMLIRDEMRAAMEGRGIALPYGIWGDKPGEAHEFLAEIMARPDLRMVAASLPASLELQMALLGEVRPQTSIWQTFIEYLRRYFKIAENEVTLLDAAMRQVEMLSADARQQRDLVPLQSKLQALASRPDYHETIAAAKDRLGGVGIRWRRFGLSVGMLDQIVRQFKDIFPSNGLARVEEAMQRMATFSDKRAEEGRQWAQKLHDLKASNRAEYDRAANVILRANIDDFDPSQPPDERFTGDKMRHYQARARFAEVAYDYNNLKPETQKLLRDASAFFRSMQNELARTKAEETIKLLGLSNLSPAQIDEIVEATVNGTLTEKDPATPTGKSHEELIDNSTIFKALQGAEEMRLARGMYFPLMRHGDYVVRTVERVDPGAGKIVEGGTEKDDFAVIEFRAGTDKEARKQWEAWADANTDGPNVVSVVKKRYLTSTGQEVSAADATGQPHEVAYHVRLRTRGVHFFRSPSEAKRFIREEGANYAHIDRKELQRADYEAAGDLSTTHLAALMSAVDNRSDIGKSEKEMMKATIQQAAVQLMPGNRIQHRSLKRKGVKGASEDFAANTISYAESASRALAKLKHMPAVRDAVKDMRADIKEAGVGSELAQAQGQVLHEVEKRINGNVLHPREAPQWVQDIMALSFMDKLFSPAYSIVNGMQPWMVTGPVLGGRFGMLRTGAALGRAYSTIGARGAFAGGLGNTARATARLRASSIDPNDVVGSIRRNVAKAEDGKRLSELFDLVVDERGLIDQNAGLEIAGAIAGGRGRAGALLAQVDRIARQLPIAVEAINRSVTLVAAYRLSYATTGDHALSMQAAIDAMNETQFNYASYNTPAWFQNPLLRPALQFKKYAQAMTALLADMAGRAFGPNTPRKERMEAFRQLMGIVGVQVAMAGALSLPGLELVKGAALIAAALGVGDGWDEWERKLRRLADDSFGKPWGELVTRGVISRAVGIDLSSRLSLADMWTFGEPNSGDRKDTLAYVGQMLAGAPGGMLLDWVDGIKDAGNGDYAKAFERMVPNKLIADITKGMRGRLDPQAKTPMTADEAVVQAIGFRPSRVSEKGEELGARIALQKKTEAAKKQLQDRYLTASSKGELLKLKGQIVAHNKLVEQNKLGLRSKTLAITTLDKIRKENASKRRALIGD